MDEIWNEKCQITGIWLFSDLKYCKGVFEKDLQLAKHARKEITASEVYILAWPFVTYVLTIGHISILRRDLKRTKQQIYWRALAEHWVYGENNWAIVLLTSNRLSFDACPKKNITATQLEQGEQDVFYWIDLQIVKWSFYLDWRSEIRPIAQRM